MRVTRPMRFVVESGIICLWMVCMTPRLTAQPIQVPITVSEALTASAAGVDRALEPVTVGIPLPEDASISSINQLGVGGTPAYQFRQLDVWPSGKVKWVLVDFLADVSAKSSAAYILTSGTGATGGANLASESTGYIWVNTGAMEAEITKSKFNLVNQIKIGGSTLVASNSSSGIFLMGADGAIYSSMNDPAPRVSIEENGPVRAVIKVEGSHYSSSQKKLLDYTIRMHFYRGKARIRLFYTLRNANRNQVINAGIKYLDLKIKTVMQNGQFQLPTHDSFVNGSLSASDSVSLYQAYSSYPQVMDYGFVSPIPQSGDRYAQEGYQIIKNHQTILAEAGRDNYPDLFYGRLSSSQGMAMAGIRFAAGWWPKSLQTFANGTISIGLWPKENPNTTYVRFGSHTTFEVLLEFSRSQQYDATAAMRKFQYPLVARGPVNWYNDSQALYEKIVSFSEEASYYTAQGWPATPRRPYKGLRIFRHKYWGEGGGTNQYDFTRINLINFIREAQLFGGEYFLMAEQRLQYNADQAAYHSDNFDLLQTLPPELQGQPYGGVLNWPSENADKVPTDKVIFELEHRHWYGMSLYYFLTGDERFKEAIFDWGEYLMREAQSDQNAWLRALAWNIFGLTELHRFTHERKYMDLAKKLFHDEIFNRTLVPNQSSGFDWERGYFVDRNSLSVGSSRLSIFAHSGILYRALWLLYQELSFDDLDKLHVGQVLTGMSWFTYVELWFDYGAGFNDYGYPYRYDLYIPPPPDVRLTNEWYGGMREVFYAMAIGYELTGDTKFLTRTRETLKKVAYMAMKNYWFEDYPGIQHMLYLMNNQQTMPVWRPLDVITTRNSDGSYALRWVVPSGARRLQVKYSEKQMVESLGFNRQTRTYQHDPQSHEAYFSANALSGVPALGKAGSQQSMTVSNLDPKKAYYFMAKVYADRAVVTGVDQKSKGSLLPAQFRILPNFPNPFNPETTIPFELPRQSEVDAKIYDARGNEIMTLLQQPMAAGSHLLTWQGHDRAGHEVASGLYFLKIQAEEEVATRKMLLLR